MGNDGGSVAKRSDVVKQAQEKTTAQEFEERELADMWTVCRISGEPLCDPVVSDWEGRLYNKQSVLEVLLKERTSQIKLGNIKDFVELSRHIDGEWKCPITGLSIVKEGSGSRIVYLIPCGHVGVEDAILDKHKCCVCQSRVFSEGVVVVNAKGHDLKLARERIENLNKAGKFHSLKPSKRKRAPEEAAKPAVA